MREAECRAGTPNKALHRTAIELSAGVVGYRDDGDWDGRNYSVIVVDGEPYGYCSIEHRPADVHVRELVISPRHQRRGLGTAILRSVMRTAEERSVAVVPGTLHENQAAMFPCTGRLDRIGGGRTRRVRVFCRPPAQLRIVRPGRQRRLSHGIRNRGQAGRKSNS